jgi:hypothetical protein
VNDIFQRMLINYSSVLENVQKPHPALNNRKLDRIPIVTGVYVLISWKELENHISMGQLIDINGQGCAFSYVADKSTPVACRLQKNCKLRIIGPFKMVELKKNVVVYDIELSDYSTAQISTRRCGIQFESEKISCKRETEVECDNHSTTHTVQLRAVRTILPDMLPKMNSSLKESPLRPTTSVAYFRESRSARIHSAIEGQ